MEEGIGGDPYPSPDGSKFLQRIEQMKRYNICIA
jgi:hypothetical protein